MNKLRTNFSFFVGKREDNFSFAAMTAQTGFQWGSHEIFRWRNIARYLFRKIYQQNSMNSQMLHIDLFREIFLLFSKIPSFLWLR
jgi:hypothetical protein